MDKKAFLKYVIEQLQNVDTDNLESVAMDVDELSDGKSMYIRLYFDNDLKAKHKRHNELEDYAAGLIPKVNVQDDVSVKEPSLLTIELQNETSVPKVFYKGAEIELKQNISFDWDTDTEFMGGLSYAIEHAVKDKGYPVTNRIERRVKGHATN